MGECWSSLEGAIWKQRNNFAGVGQGVGSDECMPGFSGAGAVVIESPAASRTTLVDPPSRSRWRTRRSPARALSLPLVVLPDLLQAQAQIALGRAQMRVSEKGLDVHQRHVRIVGHPQRGGVPQVVQCPVRRQHGVRPAKDRAHRLVAECPPGPSQRPPKRLVRSGPAPTAAHSGKAAARRTRPAMRATTAIRWCPCELRRRAAHRRAVTGIRDAGRTGRLPCGGEEFGAALADEHDGDVRVHRRVRGKHRGVGYAETVDALHP